MSGFVVSLVAGLLSVAALVFDGSRLVAVRAELNDHAANAARAAAQEIVDVRLGAERIDPQSGRLAARRYLDRHDLVGEVEIEGLKVRVSVATVVPMTLLSLVGVGPRSVSATRVVVVVDG
jgi:hypothetical protein